MLTVEASLVLASLGPGADAVASLLLQAVARDTVAMIPVPGDPGLFSRVVEVMRGLMTIAIVVLTFAVVPAAWNFRKSYQKISDLLDRVYADVNPITHHVSRITENVDYVTTAVRADVQRTSATLADANARLQEAVRLAERRAKEFEALLSVAQEEAENTFVSTAAAVRGVRTGVSRLRDDLATPALPPRSRGRSRALGRRRPLYEDVYPDELDDTLDDELDDALDVERDAAASASLDEPADGFDSLAAVDRVRDRETLERPEFVDDTLEDFYDMEEERDGEDDTRASGTGGGGGGGSGERPRVRPRRGRAG